MKVLLCANNFSHSPGCFSPRNIFPHYVICCFSSPFIYEIGGRMLSGNSGDYLIMTPGTLIYHGPKDTTESFTNDWMHIAGEDLTALLKDYPLPLNTAFSIGHPDFLKHYIAQIEEELLLKRPGYEQIISGYMTDAIIKMHRLYQKHLHPDSAAAQIGTARRVFLQNLSKQWTLKEMAELSGYSISRFSFLYNKFYGQSPKAELIAARIELARQLLLYSSYSITEIAEHCGFQSIYYFSNYFKQAVGVTPSEYMKLYTEKSFDHVLASSDIPFSKRSS